MPVVVALRPSGLNGDVLTFHMAQLAQAFPEGPEQNGQGAGVATRVKRGARRQNTHSGNLRRLRLCERCERCCDCACAKRYEQFSAIVHPPPAQFAPHYGRLRQRRTNRRPSATLGIGSDDRCKESALCAAGLASGLSFLLYATQACPATQAPAAFRRAADTRTRPTPCNRARPGDRTARNN